MIIFIVGLNNLKGTKTITIFPYVQQFGLQHEQIGDGEWCSISSCNGPPTMISSKILLSSSCSQFAFYAHREWYSTTRVVHQPLVQITNFFGNILVFSVLWILYFQFLWIAHFWLPFRYPLTFILYLSSKKLGWLIDV